MPRFGLMGIALVAVVLAACSGDAISPSDNRTPASGVIPKPQPVGEAAVCTAEAITADLTNLMNGLVPNDNSTLGKFQYVQTLMGYNNPDSTAKARDFTVNTIISFITLKYGQAPSAVQEEFADEYEQVKAELLCFVGLFTIPRGNTPKVVVTTNQLMGIWFPDEFCPEESCSGINVALDILTACTSPGEPAGCTPAPFGTLLDLYGNYLKVTLSGDTGNQNPNVDAIVGICAPSETAGILDQLRILHQADGTTNTDGLTILDGVAIPQELDEVLLCDSHVFAHNTQEPAPKSMFARMVNGLANLLLPEKAAATRMMLGGFGIGGTTRTFSPFVLGSTTFTATGIGGAKSSFSPANPDAPAAAAPALTVDPNVTLIDSVYAKQYSQLPSVSVKTGLGTAIPGVKVTFTVNEPVTAPYDGTPSAASVCLANGSDVTSFEATTNAQGVATIPCMDFGATVGYTNLHAVIDPTTAEGVAGAGEGELTVTACNPDCDEVGSPMTELNWLVQTTPGAAAKLSLNQTSWSAAAGAALNPQPVVTVTDLYGNVVTSSSAVITATAPTKPTGATGGLIGETTATAASGIATYTDLGIGGTSGSWELSFGSGTLTPAAATVTLVAGTAADIKTFMLPGPTAAATYTYTTGLVPGGNASPAPQVIVKDAYGNPVSGVALTWSPLLGSNGSVLTVGAGSTTNASGTAQVTSWAFGDGVNEADASITASPAIAPAQFMATTPTGVANFSCLSGTSKRDLVPWSVVRPNGSVKEVTIWMSVTGQSNLTEPYDATLRVYEAPEAFTSPTGVPARTVNGSVLLPGNNGNPTAVTFSLPTALPKVSGNNTLYFRLDISAPTNRKFQLWYGTSTSGDCGKVLMYPSFPTLSPTVKGMRIQLTN